MCELLAQPYIQEFVEKQEVTSCRSRYFYRSDDLEATQKGFARFKLDQKAQEHLNPNTCPTDIMLIVILCVFVKSDNQTKNMLPSTRETVHHHQRPRWLTHLLIIIILLQFLVILALLNKSFTSMTSQHHRSTAVDVITSTILSSQISSNELAYVTAITNDKYYPGVIVLSKSLKKVKSRVKLHCMITNSVSQSVRDEMEKKDICSVIVVESIPSPYKEHIQARWADTFTKIRVFGLTQFKRVVFLDADMIVLQNIDHLFDVLNGRKEQFAAVIDCCNHFNSGLMVLPPSQTTLNEIIDGIRTGSLTSYDRADQGILNDYFKNNFIQLEFKYNVDQLYISHYPHAYDINKDISVLHYVHMKPWGDHDDSKMFTMEKEEIVKLRKIWEKYDQE
jgi:alpha-N-acetylglucosamine transferase